MLAAGLLKFETKSEIPLIRLGKLQYESFSADLSIESLEEQEVGATARDCDKTRKLLQALFTMVAAVWMCDIGSFIRTGQHFLVKRITKKFSYSESFFFLLL